VTDAVVHIASTDPSVAAVDQDGNVTAVTPGTATVLVSCVDLDAAQLNQILRQVLYEFPVREMDFALPRWVTMLEPGHWLQAEVYAAAMQFAEGVARMKDIPGPAAPGALDCAAVQRSAVSGMDLA